MKHFYKNIQGWFGCRELYRAMVMEFKDGAHFVEIGAWKGQSAAFLAVEIINSNKKIQFDIVDTWKGAEEHIDPNNPSFEPILLEKGTIYHIFKKNMEPVWNYINPIISDSVEASKNYEDGSLDFIYVDGAHDYESVSTDIRHWHPKLKPKGIIAGDDFGGWEGVSRSVEENFKGQYLVHDNNLWLHSNKPDFPYEKFAHEYLKKSNFMEKIFSKFGPAKKTGEYV